MTIVTTPEIAPDLKSLINMIRGKLDTVTVLVEDTDKLRSVQTAKHLKQMRGLVDLLREQINDFRQTSKATIAPKEQHDTPNSDNVPAEKHNTRRSV